MKPYPFVFGKAVKGAYFTDREKETAKLEANLRNGVNTILVSPRRIGKTSLVEKVRKRFINEEGLKVVFLDIFKCRSEEEFLQSFSDNVLRQTASKMEEWINYAKKFLSRLSPKINISPEPGSGISLGFDLMP